METFTLQGTKRGNLERLNNLPIERVRNSHRLYEIVFFQEKQARDSWNKEKILVEISFKQTQ